MCNCRNRYLLIAGSNYYPSAGVSDWIRTFSTYEEALAAVSQDSNMKYKICDDEYDWYEIVNLDDWT